MIGKTVSHYRILEKLGEGGMGVVYKAEDTQLKRLVALKFLPSKLTSKAEARKRFLREARAAAGLDHQNICAVYEIDQNEEDQIFIAMAFYEGATLTQTIGKGPLKFRDALEITTQAAEGLAKAHGKEIVHRDIKPANIMVTKEGMVKIIDFGLARLKGETRLTKEITTMGTASYMSPEQAEGKEADHRSDIWSLGVVLYEMVTGQLPFKGDQALGVIYAIVNKEPMPVDQLRPDSSPELKKIILKALAKDPAQRYQRMEELLKDLKRLDQETTAEIISSLDLKQEEKRVHSRS